MKLFTTFLFLLLSFSSFAQEILVRDKKIDLGEISEIRNGGKKVVTFKVDASSPKKFKVKFAYHYNFEYEVINEMNLSGAFTTNRSIQVLDSHRNLIIDTSKSLEPESTIVLTISKRSRLNRKISIDVKSLSSEEKITVEKGVLGLFADHYILESACQQ